MFGSLLGKLFRIISAIKHPGLKPLSDDPIGKIDCLLALTKECRVILVQNRIPDLRFGRILLDLKVGLLELSKYAMRWKTIQLWIDWS